jgi:hypothetical protein
MEQIAYYVRYAAIYMMFGLTMGISSWEKLTGGVPDWFSEQFGDTFVAGVPGLAFSWKLAGILEVAVAVVLVVSLVMLEVLPNRPKPWLKLSLGIAALTFVMLGVGQRITSEFEGAASLFFYFGATMATLLVVAHDEIRYGEQQEQ